MPFSFRIVLLTLVAGLIGAGSAHAQSPASSARPDSTRGTTSSVEDAPAWLDDPHRFSVWMGGSNEASRLLGRIREAEFRVVGVRYRRRLSSPNDASQPSPLAIYYTADLIPWAQLSVPGSAIPSIFDLEGQPLPRQSLTTTGVGAVPFGLQINYRLVPRIQPFVSTSLGFLYFVDSVPDKRGKQFNFTVDFGLGVQLTLSDRLHLLLGYRYHHLSNGYRGRINPGVDANLFYVGTAVGL